MTVESPEFEFHPPAPERVAARALILAAIACRGLIEKDAAKPGAEDLRQRVCQWLHEIGIAEEVEDCENRVLITPLGQLTAQAAIDASWRSEGMVVLGWALGRLELPAYHTQCEPSDSANLLGFLDDPVSSVLARPRLRPPAQIEHWADSYLTLHWRLREFSLRPKPIDFVSYVERCTWGPLTLEELYLLDRDLAVGRARLDRLPEPRFRQLLSITQERQQALNWLLGEEPLYSQVTTDT